MPDEKKVEEKQETAAERRAREERAAAKEAEALAERDRQAASAPLAPSQFKRGSA